MDGLHRITFRFGPDIEVRYLPASPEPGAFVNHRSELWIVSFVTADSAGMTVICEPAAPALGGEARSASTATPAIVATWGRCRRWGSNPHVPKDTGF